MRYLRFKKIQKKFGLDRFALRESKVLPLEKDWTPEIISEDNCVLVSKFIDFSTVIERLTYKKLLLENFYRASIGDAKALKFLRDLLVGFRWSGSCDFGQNTYNFIFFHDDNQLRVLECDTEVFPPFGYDSYGGVDSRGLVFMKKPWEVEDKDDVIKVNGERGLDCVARLIFSGDTETLKAFYVYLKEFVELPDPSIGALCKMLQAFEKKRGGAIRSALSALGRRERRQRR